MTDRVLLIEPDGLRAATVASHLSQGLRAAGHTCLCCDVSYSKAARASRIGNWRQADRTTRDCNPRSVNRSDASGYVSIERAREWDFHAIRRLRRLIVEWQPDVIYVMPGGADRMTLAAARLLDCRVVLQRRSPLATVDRWLLAGDVVYLASSESQRLGFQRCGLPVLESSWVDSCGSPHDDEQTAPLNKQHVTQALQVPGSSKLFGIVADLVDDDHLRDAIWISDLLKVMSDDSQLLIFGDGPEWVRLERFRRRLEIEDRVHLMGQLQDVLRWLPALDGYWCAAGDDSIDFGLCEALRLGLPIVASDTAGHRELVQSEESGLLFPVGNRARFSRQAFRILEESELAKRLGEAARTRWADRFSPEAMLERFVDAHARLMSTLPAAA